MKKVVFFGVLSLTLFLSSCASIVSGSKQKFNFTSTPIGAKVYVDDVDLGVTPVEAKLERVKKDQKVKIVLDGYKPYEITLTRKTNGWVWGNIVFGGLIGLVIDMSSGAVYRLTPKEINAELANGLTMNKNNDTYIGVVLEANENWEKIGTLDSN